MFCYDVELFSVLKSLTTRRYRTNFEPYRLFSLDRSFWRYWAWLSQWIFIYWNRLPYQNCSSEIEIKRIHFKWWLPSGKKEMTRILMKHKNSDFTLVYTFDVTWLIQTYIMYLHMTKTGIHLLLFWLRLFTGFKSLIYIVV